MSSDPFPAREVVHDLFRRLRSNINRSKELESRLGRAVDRERRSGKQDNVWPKNVGMDQSSSPSKNRISPTESSAMRRMKPYYFRDPHHALVVEAIRGLMESVRGMERMIDRLESLDDLQKTKNNEIYCEACSSFVEKSRKTAHCGTVGDRLLYAIDLCSPCYNFVVQTAKPGSFKGFLPSERQIKYHEQHGRWKIRKQ